MSVETVPVVRADLASDRIDFELECGHIVGLARADVAIFNEDDELELPTSLSTCPVCQLDAEEIPAVGKKREVRVP